VRRQRTRAGAARPFCLWDAARIRRLAKRGSRPVSTAGMQRADRVAVISDVHGNAVALGAVFHEVSKEAPDLLVFGGDLTWGSLPEETWRLVDRVLRGGQWRPCRWTGPSAVLSRIATERRGARHLCDSGDAHPCPDGGRPATNVAFSSRTEPATSVRSSAPERQRLKTEWTVPSSRRRTEEAARPPHGGRVRVAGEGTREHRLLRSTTVIDPPRNCVNQPMPHPTPPPARRRGS
jgi:Calcineurin-like phosphoesterase